VADEIRAWARANMSPDPHGTGPLGDEYRIATIYLDTPELDVLRRSGTGGRGKFRIRRYGDSDDVYLERKVKRLGRVRKLRTLVPRAELEILREDLPTVHWAGYWFHRRAQNRALRPVCQVAYRRVARMLSSAAGTLRLTIDDELRSRRLDSFDFPDDQSCERILGDQLVMEMKFVHPMPDLFLNVVERFGLTTVPASKYRIAGAALGLEAEVACA